MIQMEQRIKQLETERDMAEAYAESRNRVVDALAEALIEMRYGHTDKAEKMAIEALNYLTK